MKKIYLAFIPITLLLITACSKDFLKSYDKRITGGTWELYDVNTFGIGSRYDPVFNSGRFTFESNGQVTYTTNLGEVYEGTWDIRYSWQDDDKVQTLYISVLNFQTREMLSEYFDDIQFTGTDRFKAFIYNGSRTYTVKFKR
ncbi:hypothetical protein FAM09_27970 [Niastella caeni]|uniref:Lipocalin-like domain-containing protein n=1 Tax=Niastella caeni TaxID=2569763 RepID=A0A4S8HBF9_9BACT|nr:hypothetical protein [Niastella caeni]THU32025.1 hypothetical protein FAM09_27970 [Niastella caeni]